MDPAQALLFDGFPRSVGVSTPNGGGDLRQFLVHSRDEFRAFVEQVEGRRNLYASISQFEPVLDGDDYYVGNCVNLDKVAYDFDTTAKADRAEPGRWNHPEIAQGEGDDMVLKRMRDDPGLADSILGPVCDDVRELATASLEDGVPVVGVYSGFGVHVYQLFRPERDPAERLTSVAAKYITELSLATADGSASGKPFRVLRIPNVRRTWQGEPTDTWVVPLSGRELAEIEPEQLAGLSTAPRPDAYQEPGERPEMPLYEDLAQSDEIGQEKMRGTAVEFEEATEESFRELLKSLMPMPCVHERAVQPNPDHSVRYQVAAMLFNLGFTPRDAHNLIRHLDWIDYDPETTGEQLKYIWNGNTGEKGCKAMMADGLCQRADDPHACPTFGWRGGDKLWP